MVGPLQLKTWAQARRTIGERTGNPSRLRIGHWTFSRKRWTAPVWKTKDTVIRKEAFYLEKYDDSWFILKGPAKLGNYELFHEARVDGRLMIVWQSRGGDIMHSGHHAWGVFDPERQAWAAVNVTHETVIL